MKETSFSNADFLYRVDSLCIIQDNPDEVKQMIGDKDKVYLNATLTIVAAGGENANAGLARLKSTTGPSPEPNFMIEGALLVAAIQPRALFFEGVKWELRGWSYQEATLSKRSIIFMENSMCWHCPNGVHEDHAPLYINEATAFSHFGSATIPISQNIKDLKAFAFYEDYVKRYNQRELTKQEDALNSISAIVSYLKRELNTEFHWGESGSMLCIKLGHFVREKSTGSRPVPVDGTFLLRLQSGANKILPSSWVRLCS